MSNSVGVIIRKWRKARMRSQLHLSLEMGISAKHISFIETGRSVPSRKMIVKIGEFLNLPKREINTALYSAGYAPVYTELSFDDNRLKPVFDAIDQMIANHMPYPAIVMNQSWNIINANESAKSLMSELGFSGYENLIEALIHDNPEKSKITNWHETVAGVLARLRHEISMQGGSDRLDDLEKRLNLCLSPNADVIDIIDSQPFLSTKLRVYDKELSFFSIISQLSTIQDITVSEVKIELLFPTDERTREFYGEDV